MLAQYGFQEKLFHSKYTILSPPASGITVPGPYKNSTKFIWVGVWRGAARVGSKTEDKVLLAQWTNQHPVIILLSILVKLIYN